MAPQANDGSKQLLAQAAQKLMEAVRDTGLAQPTPFAAALLELIECSAKLQEFDDMASEAQAKQTNCEEAQAWQQIAQTTLQFCRDSLLDQQEKALQRLWKCLGKALLYIPKVLLPRQRNVSVHLLHRVSFLRLLQGLPLHQVSRSTIRDLSRNPLR